MSTIDLFEDRPSGGMADTTDSKSVAERHVGSTPTLGTNFCILCGGKGHYKT